MTEINNVPASAKAGAGGFRYNSAMFLRIGISLASTAHIVIVASFAFFVTVNYLPFNWTIIYVGLISEGLVSLVSQFWRFQGIDWINFAANTSTFLTLALFQARIGWPIGLRILGAIVMLCTLFNLIAVPMQGRLMNRQRPRRPT